MSEDRVMKMLESERNRLTFLLNEYEQKVLKTKDTLSLVERQMACTGHEFKFDSGYMYSARVCVHCGVEDYYD